MKRAALGFVLLAFIVPLDAHASTPVPWCGTEAATIDRLPDLTPGFSVHVVYAHPSGAPNRLAEWAPRIAGDAAAIDAWWRSQDPARTPRFDLHSFSCASVFGALDLSLVTFSRQVSNIDRAFLDIRDQLGEEHGFFEAEKVYLVYFDGPTGQGGRDEEVCGQAATSRRGAAGTAIVYLDSCGSSDGDASRPIVVAHELLHAFGAVDRSGAPHACAGGHVCDSRTDLMTPILEDGTLELRVLDAGRDDYYGHPGSWPDVQDSRFLERLDSPDRTPPSAPGAPTVVSDHFGELRLSWQAATDDVGPVSYRVSLDGVFQEELRRTTAFQSAAGGTTTYTVRAVDGVGRLSPPVSVRFTAGLGIVDAAGRLLRDTVPPSGVTGVTIRKQASRVVVTWARARDRGGVRTYRIRIGPRTLTTTQPSVSIHRTRLTGGITIVAVDRAGNLGPATRIPLSRLR